MFSNQKIVSTIKHHDTSKSDFNAEKLVSMLIANCRCTDDERIDLQNLIPEIVSIVSRNADRSGVHDARLIMRVILAFFLSENKLRDFDGSGSIGYFIAYSSATKTKLSGLKRYDKSHSLDTLFYENDPLVLARIVEQLHLVEPEQLPSEYLHDFISIIQFLLHKENSQLYFDILESNLQQCASTLPVEMRLPIRESDGKYILPVSAENPYKRHKILSSYLYDWAIEAGFKSRTKIINPLSTNAFFSMLSTYSIFKDCATEVGSLHGIWSHALQWYMIFEHQKRHSFLQHSAMELYHQYGNPDGNRHPDSKGYEDLWTNTFDKYNTGSMTSPEFITKMLTEDDENSKRWPLLTESVKRAELKTRQKFRDRDGYTAYLKEKHYGKQVEGKVVSAIRGQVSPFILSKA